MYRGIDICIHSEPGHLLVFQLADTTFSFLTNIFFYSAIAFTVNLRGAFARCTFGIKCSLVSLAGEAELGEIQIYFCILSNLTYIFSYSFYHIK